MTGDAAESAIAEIAELLDRRRTAQAKVRLAAAQKQFPDNIDLLLQSATADYYNGDTDNAWDSVQQVLVHDPDNETALYLVFELTFDKGDLAEAERLIISLLHADPSYAPYYARYGSVMIQSMNVGKARALAEEGRGYDPEDPGCLALQTLCDFIENRQGASSHAMQQLLVRQPESVQTLALLMNALHDRGDFGGAYRIAQELVRAQPDNEDFVDAAAEFKAVSHWSMLPLWPMRKWGHAASIALWLTVIVLVHLLKGANPVAAGAIAVSFFIYVVYSWAWPPFLRRQMLK